MKLLTTSNKRPSFLNCKIAKTARLITNNAKKSLCFFFLMLEFVVVIAAKICSAFDEEGGAETEGA